MLEHASRVKGRKCPSGRHRAVLGQALFPKSITVTPLQSQALEFISFSSVDKPLPLCYLMDVFLCVFPEQGHRSVHPASKAKFFSKSTVLCSTWVPLSVRPAPLLFLRPPTLPDHSA